MKIGKYVQKKKSKGFTLIELLVTIAIIAILAAILFPVFARAREQARKAACMSNLKQIGLAIIQYTQDFDEKYPIANNGSGLTWYAVLQPYVKSYQVFTCPTAGQINLPNTSNRQYSGGYGWNISGTQTFANIANGFGYSNTNWGTPNGNGPLSLATVPEPAETIIVADPASNGYKNNAYFAVGYSTGNSYTPVLHGGQVGPFTGDGTLSAVAAGGGGNYLFADGHVKFVQASQAYCSNMWDVIKDVTAHPPTCHGYH